MHQVWHSAKLLREQSCYSNQPVPQCVAKINLCKGKLQEPFVPLCPFNKLSFCWVLECVQLNCCTLLKMNVCIQTGRKSNIGTIFSKSRLVDLALHLRENQDLMALSEFCITTSYFYLSRLTDSFTTITHFQTQITNQWRCLPLLLSIMNKQRTNTFPIFILSHK